MSQNSFDEVLAQVNQLPLTEQQKLYTILGSKLSPMKSPRAKLVVENADFSSELQWLDQHRDEYAGRWVALKGDGLIAHGATAKEVYAAANAAGVELPLVTRVEDPNALPFAGV